MLQESFETKSSRLVLLFQQEEDKQSGNDMPPMLLFPRKRMTPVLISKSQAVVAI